MFSPWVGKILWNRKGQPFTVSLPRKIPETKEPGMLSLGLQRCDWESCSLGHESVTQEFRRQNSEAAFCQHKSRMLVWNGWRAWEKSITTEKAFICVQLVFSRTYVSMSPRRIKKERCATSIYSLKIWRCLLLWIDEPWKWVIFFEVLYLCVLSKGCNILGLITMFIHY